MSASRLRSNRQEKNLHDLMLQYSISALSYVTGAYAVYDVGVCNLVSNVNSSTLGIQYM